MMPVPEHALVYVATYESRDAAVSDYETLARLYSRGAIHTYNATVLNGQLDGRLKIVTASAPFRGRARIVLAAGSLAGLFFPPCLLWDDPMSVAVGGGDTMKEFWRGLSRDDLRTIAKMLQHQAAAIIVISETTLHRVLKRSARGTFREFAKAVRAGDATFALDLPRAVDQWLGAA